MGLLKWAAIFAVISIIAAVFGFGGVAEGTEDIAQVLFFLFLGLAAVVVVAGMFVGRRVVD